MIGLGLALVLTLPKQRVVYGNCCLKRDWRRNMFQNRRIHMPALLRPIGPLSGHWLETAFESIERCQFLDSASLVSNPGRRAKFLSS